MATLSNNTTNDKSMNGLVTIDANSISTDELDVDTLVVNLSGTAPTVSALSNDTNIATTAWVTNHASSTYVTLAGASQTISSEKTFSNANTFITGNTVTNSIQSSAVGTTQNIATTQTSGILNIGTGSLRTGAVNIASLTTLNAPITIGSSASSTQTATHNAITTFSKIPSCAVAPTTANNLCNKTYVDGVAGGSALLTSNNTFSGTNAFTNTLNLNITGTADTNIGSASNITYLSGNTTVSGSPVVLNYAVSSHSESTAATVLTQLGGTFRSTVTWTAWTTGTFNYVMNQFIPGVPGWTWPGGFITLAKGTYSFNFAFSFEDNAAGYNITDLRVGISTSAALTAASTDTTVITSLPGGNRTCYKHYVTTITPSINDIVVEQMSGSFYLSASTAIYPHCRINNSAAGGINTVIFDLTITRIGL